MSFKIVIVLAFSYLKLTECQLGQFGLPFFNNIRDSAQSNFNPQHQHQPSFTFGGDFVFPQNPYGSSWQSQPYRPATMRPVHRPTSPPTRPPPPPPPPPTKPPIPIGGILQSNRVGGRISLTKCEEYSKLVKKTIQFASLSIGSEAQNVQVSKCDYTSTSLIVGGEDALKGEFPHMAAIGYKDLNDDISYKCGGSLISERFVLTAAHCETSDRVKPTEVRLGAYDISTHDRGSPEIDIPIERFIRHESYNRDTRENDIALIKMSRSPTLSKWIRPACIGQPNVQIKPKVVATGWGYTEVGGQTSDILQKVQLSVIDNDKCRNVYNDIENYQVYPSQLCAGELVGGKDTCGGDSGGPLQTTINNNECIFQIVGITSYGSTFCGAKNSPGIYTRVRSYTDWIEKHVWG